MKDYMVHRARKPQPYKIPPEIKGSLYLDFPLYMIIAYWALLRGEPVTVRDVRLAFNISLRRASDMLEYLTEQGSKAVQAECFLLPPSGNSKCKRRAWRILSVNGEKARVMKPLSERKETPELVSEGVNPGECFTALRRWAISRREGEGFPQHLIGNKPNLQTGGKSAG
jgi:hypothetical protein